MLLGKDAFERCHEFILECHKKNDVVDESKFDEWIGLHVNINLVPESLIKEFRIMYVYWLYGKKHFHIEDGLANMLVQTDLHKVDSSLLRLPYRSVYFTVPENLVEVEFPSHLFDNDAPVKGFAVGAYVYEWQWGDGKRQLEINASIKIKQGDVVGGKGMAGLVIPLNDGENVFDAIKEKLPSTRIAPFLAPSSKVPFPDITRIILERFSLLVVNVLLYLNSDKAIIDNTADYFEEIHDKSRKRKKKRNKSNSDSYIRVGRSVTINNKYKKIYDKFNILETTGNNRREYKGQWIVRGHWRNQAYGEDLSKRKLIWIEPHIKGSGDLEEKEYIIK